MQGRSLEAQVEAAAGGRPEGPLGVVAEVVLPQAATGRSDVTPPTRGAKEGVAAVHAACGDVGRSGGLSVCTGCVWAVHVQG